MLSGGNVILGGIRHEEPLELIALELIGLELKKPELVKCEDDLGLVVVARALLGSLVLVLRLDSSALLDSSP